jgi:hypothetical protein
VTTYIYNPKLNDLQATIKVLATEGRSIRNEARDLTDEARHSRKQDALHVGADARIKLLAYGYLRGRTISQIESPHSRPENLPSAESIIACALEHFRPRGEEQTEAEQDAAKAALQAVIETDLKAWRKTLILNAIHHDALRRIATVQKAVA